MSDDYFDELKEVIENERKYLCDSCEAINSPLLLNVVSVPYNNTIRLCETCHETLHINRELEIFGKIEYSLHVTGWDDNIKIYVELKKQEPRKLKF